MITIVLNINESDDGNMVGSVGNAYSTAGSFTLVAAGSRKHVIPTLMKAVREELERQLDAPDLEVVPGKYDIAEELRKDDGLEPPDPVAASIEEEEIPEIPT